MQLSELMMKLKESDKVFATLLALNVAVFLGWRVPAAQQFMIKYFSLNLFTSKFKSGLLSDLI